MTVLDRTADPSPLIVTEPTDMRTVKLIDKNPTRPAVIVMGTEFAIGAIERLCDGRVYRAEHQGLGTFYNGSTLPRTEIDWSFHDECNAAISAHGSCKIDAGRIKSNVCINLTAGLDGKYGWQSRIHVAKLDGYVFGVLGSGQRGLDVNIGTANAYLWPDDDRMANGHAFYANESRQNGEYLRLIDVVLTIHKARGKAMGGATRGLHPTVKLKGAWGVNYVGLDDQNPGGALDSFESCGSAMVNWRHPGGPFMNPVFAALRLGDRSSFGTPPFDLAVGGVFDGSKAPDQDVPVAAIHVLDGAVRSLGVLVTGKTDVYGAARELFPIEVSNVES